MNIYHQKPADQDTQCFPRRTRVKEHLETREPHTTFVLFELIPYVQSNSFFSHVGTFPGFNQY